MFDLPECASLDLELDAGWLTVWFNQPEKRNPLTNERIDDLIRLCEGLNGARDVRGVTFRGRGGVFCAGGDLKTFKTVFQGGGTPADVMETSIKAARMMDAVNALPQVTVMAVEGAAMAGGFGLVCCGDVVVADANARFSLTETMIGLAPAQICPFVLQRLGAREGRRLMLLASSLKGEEARNAGLVDTLVEGTEELDAALAGVGKQVRRCAPGAVAETKRLILTLPQLLRDEQLRVAAESFAERIMCEEGREGIASFFEKRTPQWADG